MKQSSVLHALSVTVILSVITTNLPAMMPQHMAMPSDSCDSWQEREIAQIPSLSNKINDFVRLIQRQHRNPNDWYNGITPNAEWYAHHPTPNISNYATFFTEKMTTEPNPRLVVFGDLHGCDFTPFDQKCQELNLINAEGSLNQDNTYVIFLGDYFAKGKHPFTTLSKILDMKSRNPDRVFFLRGNHDEDFVDQYFYECRPAETNTYNLLEEHQQFKPQLARFKEHLPSALYLRIPDAGQPRYILFCHGTPEPGHNPYPFLDSDARFENIKTIHRRQFCDQFQFETVAFPRVDPDVELMGQQFLERYNKDNLQTIHPYAEAEYWGDRVFLQYIWGYINDTDNTTCCKLLKHRICYSFTRAQMEYMLSNPISRTRILSVVRAHQHQDNPGNPMLQRLTEERGLIRHWNGLCYTVVSSPQTTKPKRCNEPIGHYSFLTMQLFGEQSNWNITHYAKREDEADFSFRTHHMF